LICATSAAPNATAEGDALAGADEDGAVEAAPDPPVDPPVDPPPDPPLDPQPDEPNATSTTAAPTTARRIVANGAEFIGSSCGEVVVAALSVGSCWTANTPTAQLSPEREILLPNDSGLR
jgi:hypothetical protein